MASGARYDDRTRSEDDPLVRSRNQRAVRVRTSGFAVIAGSLATAVGAITTVLGLEERGDRTELTNRRHRTDRVRNELEGCAVV